MQSHKLEQAPIDQNSLKKDINRVNTISDLATRNVFIGVGTASILYPLDMGLYALYSKVNQGKPKIVVSVQPCRAGLMAAVWTSYKYAVTAATMKVTTKQQSQGAKAYLLDEKITPMEEGMDSIEGVPELLESKISKSSGLRNTGMAVTASMLFGGVEAFITQANANSSVLSKEHLLATKQDRTFELPRLNTPYDRVRYHFAGLPIRSVKSSLQVGAFMATDAMEKYLLAKGYDVPTAKIASITMVATSFGLGMSILTRGHTEQILTMNAKTISVESAKKIISNIIKHSGPKRIIGESAITMFYTGVVQAIVPPIERYVDEKIVSKKRDLQSNLSSTTKNGFGLFNTNSTVADNKAEVKTEQADVSPHTCCGVPGYIIF